MVSLQMMKITMKPILGLVMALSPSLAMELVENANVLSLNNNLGASGGEKMEKISIELNNDEPFTFEHPYIDLDTLHPYELDVLDVPPFDRTTSPESLVSVVSIIFP